MRCRATTLVILVGVLGLPGCGGTYQYDVPVAMRPSMLPPVSPVGLGVEIIIPPGTQALQSATAKTLAPCENTFVLSPSPYGTVFRQTVEDRFRGSFQSAQLVSSLQEAGGSNAILEARLDDVDFRLGCGFNDTFYVTVSGVMRAVTPDGRELWRSATTQRKADLPRITMVSAMGQGVSGAMAGLVEDWVAELRSLPPSQFAFNMSRQGPRTVQKASPRQAPPSPPLAAPPPPPRFAEQPVVLRFPRGPERPNDVAVIIGNADYGRLGKDIPDVRPAHADAEGARLYATQALGIKEGNVIVLKDATGSQLTRVFGSDKDHRGQLFDWVKPGKSRVYVYYSGHGAPASQGGSPYLIPTDADAARIELNGYPLKQLYDNLGKLPADSVTVVLEACFSGVSPAGPVLSNASPVFFDVKAPPVPGNVTVITAGAANQMASWESDGTSSLFTKYYLKAMAGEADADTDGRVSLDELDRYLRETLTYYARRHYGRDQNAQIVKGDRR